MTTRLAAIDCGTNSTRLLVGEAEAGARTFTTLERLANITRLGEGVDRAGELTSAAIDRVAAALREYRAVLNRLEVGPEQIRITATSAARDAANRDDFFAVAHEITGVTPELITGDEEGRLSFAGATSELDPGDGPFLVVDIGGGSTEFAVGTTECEGVLSVDVGCVRLTEKELLHDPPKADELSSAVSLVHAYLEDVARELPLASETNTFVGLAGTVTTVAAVEIGLAEYDRDRIHHFVLTRAAVEDVFRTLATEKRADRIHNPGLEEARADVIVGGCCILVAVMRHFGFDECLVSEADILDGLILSQLPSLR